MEQVKLKNTPTWAEITKKLEAYDAMRRELLVLERELSRECAIYGKTIGLWGFKIDHLRMQVEEERRRNGAAQTA